MSRLQGDSTRRRFAILGSCVSADIFRLNPEVGELVLYHARCSLVSLMSSPLEFVHEDLDWPSNFSRRTVKADFEKSFFDDLEASDCDTLIVDFVDERFDVLRSGESFVTCSTDLAEAGLDRFAQHQFKRIARMDPDTHLLWRDACSRFADKLRRRLPRLAIVLHTVLPADSYRDGPDVHDLPPFADGVPLAALSSMLKHYSAYFSSQFDTLFQLENPGTYAADRNHLWGLSPFHFEESYYLDAAAFLNAL